MTNPEQKEFALLKRKLSASITIAQSMAQELQQIIGEGEQSNLNMASTQGLVDAWNQLCKEQELMKDWEL